MRSNTGLTIGCLLLTLLLAFSVGYAQKEAKEGGTITTVSTQEPGNLDPHKTGEAIANNLFLRIGLTLVDINP
ncbi:MAG: hypothetical protein ACOC82_04150 [Candidatus Bipolaricaulota bacterium]